MKFDLGQTVLTRGVAEKASQDQEFDAFVLQSISKHASGDWGTVCDEDKKANDQALNDGERLLSAYEQEGMPKIWINTEWDRSVTTVLFPEEY